MSNPIRKYCTHCNAAFASDIAKCPRDGADIEAQDINPLLGQLFGNRYQLLEQLGAGGMGEVYRAEHVTMGKSFAIKVLLGEVGADNNMVARFHREAKSLSLLSHRNIVSVTDFGETEEGLLYLVTEFVDGIPLSQEMRDSVFGIERTIHVIRQIAKALGHAHRRGLVHRDLKPDNVMLIQTDDEADVVKVLDFGIARVTDLEDMEEMVTRNHLTSQGIVMGTPAYIAPEQAMGSPLDHRADLYSLGILLYELLAGHVPFTGNSPIELISKHLGQTPPQIDRADMTGKFKAVTMRLLEKKPDDRFKDVDTFLAVLDALEDSSSTGAYTRPNKKAKSVTPTDRVAMRQGSDTLLAPAVTPANMRSPGSDDAANTDDASNSDDASNADDASNTDAPTPVAAVPTVEIKRSRLGGIVSIALALVLGSVIAVVALPYLRNSGSEAKLAAPDPGPPETVIAVVPRSDAAVDTEPAKPLAPPPLAIDAAVATDARAPAVPPRGKPVAKAPPTLPALQKKVERIGGQLNKLAGVLEKNEIDSLRRKWLDLATGLSELGNGVDERRKFAARLSRLKSAIKKASRNQ